MINRAQADHIAALVRTLRPHWDHLATLNALAAIRDRDLPEVAAFACRVAADQSLRTPAALGFADSPHWKKAPVATEDPYAWCNPTREEREAERAAKRAATQACGMCDDRGVNEGGWFCGHDPKAAEVSARGAAAARAAIRAMREAKQQEDA